MAFQWVRVGEGDAAGRETKKALRAVTLPEGRCASAVEVRPAPGSGVPALKANINQVSLMSTAAAKNSSRRNHYNDAGRTRTSADTTDKGHYDPCNRR